MKLTLSHLVVVSVVVACAGVACSSTPIKTEDPSGEAGDASEHDGSVLDGSLETDASALDAGAQPDVPQAWPARRCGSEGDAGVVDGSRYVDGGSCNLATTCGVHGSFQPGQLCDDFDICFDAPYTGTLPGRFAECEPYADAPECCAYRGPLNDDPYSRRQLDEAAMADVCALTALGAHINCMVWLN